MSTTWWSDEWSKFIECYRHSNHELSFDPSKVTLEIVQSIENDNSTDSLTLVLTTICQLMMSFKAEEKAIIELRNLCNRIPKWCSAGCFYRTIHSLLDEQLYWSQGSHYSKTLTDVVQCIIVSDNASEWLLEEPPNSHDNQHQNDLLMFCANLIRELHLIKLKDENDVLNPRDVELYNTKAYFSIHILASLLRCGITKSDNCEGEGNNCTLVWSLVRKIASSAFIFFAACHSNEVNYANKNLPWITPEAIEYIDDLISALLQTCNLNNVTSLLTGVNRSERTANKGNFINRYPDGFLSLIMKEMQPYICHSNWKLYPIAKYCLAWIISNHPHLNNHLDSCLPTILTLIDDHQVENKIISIKCLKHVIDNVDASELKRYERASVIHHALSQQLYLREPTLIPVLHSCLLSILEVIEKSPRDYRNAPRKFDNFDKIISTVLNSMEFESEIALRKAYAQNLYKFIEHMGISIVKHINKILSVLISYLEVYDGPTEHIRFLILKALKYLIIEAWPRIPAHFGKIFKSLSRLLIDVRGISATTTTPIEVENKLFHDTVQTMKLLSKCCPQLFKEYMQSIRSLNIPPLDEFISLYEKVHSESIEIVDFIKDSPDAITALRLALS
ncbi:TELO2-interacting protein 2 [Trichoplax sp. H2]|nr:TELO2-interacting protein 2 [Trichoplax sp. H2]|eukprot:RDD37353.1 TELO2-interacting protein 2 [Trichoplax sp. H2]